MPNYLIASWLLCLLSLSVSNQLSAQSTEPLTFEEYDPPSTLIVPETDSRRAKYPFIDVHNHQWNIPGQDLKALTAAMDSLNMVYMVNLSGRGFDRVTNADGSRSYRLKDGRFLKTSIEKIRAEANGRIITFTNVDFTGVGSVGWAKEAVRQLQEDYDNGARGLKIFKGLGLDNKDTEGNRIPTDDPRLAPVWEKCSELGIPVLIHTGEPWSFFQPHTAENERWLELKMFPNRYRPPERYPSWEQVMQEQHNMFGNHPNTTFINAHFGWLANDLDRLGALLDTLPNVVVEIAAIIGELGRQPRYAQRFFIKYQDRIMFGKDTWNVGQYATYFRVLQTDDEYFKYFRRRHAFWRLYGLDLPDEVLKKVYYKNAIRIIPGIDASKFPD